MINQDGHVPVGDQVIGACPPDAIRVYEYGAFTVASGMAVSITRSCTERANDLFEELPPPSDRAAVIVTEDGAPIAPTLAVNEVTVDPCGTTTLGSTETHAAEELSEIVTPPAGAGPDSPTVQTACVPELRVDGVQLRLATLSGARRVTVAVEETEPNVAVINAI